MNKRVMIGVVAVLALAGPGFAQQTDQTVPVKKGARLDVNVYGGEIVVRTWDKDAVRVQASHSSREEVRLDNLENLVRVRTASRRGRSFAVDFQITAPSWMPLALGGTYADVTVEGAQGDVTVETVHGEINVRGGSGLVSLKSMQGSVVLADAKGRCDVRSLNEAIRVAGTSCEIYAESNNGGITFEKVDARNAEASTLNGHIIYEGTIHNDGAYRFATHNGRIVLGVRDNANATINVRTFNGRFDSSVPAKVDETRKGRRYIVTVGNGSARVDLESFNGAIQLRRPEEIPAERDSRQRRKGG